jgi:hypothetical protein
MVIAKWASRPFLTIRPEGCYAPPVRDSASVRTWPLDRADMAAAASSRHKWHVQPRKRSRDQLACDLINERRRRDTPSDAFDDCRQVIELQRAMPQAVLFKAPEKCYQCNTFVADLVEGK